MAFELPRAAGRLSAADCVNDFRDFIMLTERFYEMLKINRDILGTYRLQLFDVKSEFGFRPSAARENSLRLHSLNYKNRSFFIEY